MEATDTHLNRSLEKSLGRSVNRIPGLCVPHGLLPNWLYCLQGSPIASGKEKFGSLSGSETLSEHLSGAFFLTGTRSPFDIVVLCVCVWQS